jgi:hypothetical protein
MMPFIKFISDQIVGRLRWVMIGAMLFSMVNTLSGQPESFWHHPETAIRGDGLSIHDKTNHTFEFYLGQGWPAYLGASLLYLLAAFLAVSVLPRMAALITIFSLLFGHFFGASNWLAVRWHLGVQGPSIYGFVLSTVVAFSAFPASGDADPIVRRLRWVMVCTILLDFTLTLLGQPGSYWRHPETMHEANALSRLFLGYGWMVFILYALFYAWAAFQMASILPRMIALTCIFSFIFGTFSGASNWFFYQWRIGMQAPIIYGVALSVIIVLLAFPAFQERNG